MSSVEKNQQSYTPEKEPSTSVSIKMHDTVIETEGSRYEVATDIQLLENNLNRRFKGTPEITNTSLELDVYWGGRPLEKVMAERAEVSEEELKFLIALDKILIGDASAMVVKSSETGFIYINMPKVIKEASTTENPARDVVQQIINIWLHETEHVIQINDPQKQSVIDQEANEQKLWMISSGATLTTLFNGLIIISMKEKEKSLQAIANLLQRKRALSRRDFLATGISTISFLFWLGYGARLGAASHYQFFNQIEKEAREAGKNILNILEVGYAFELLKLE